MPRKPRIWFPGATFHITSRGNRKEPIFYDDVDRLTYLKFLVKTNEEYPFLLHSYCLMTNHIHLLLQTNTSPTNQVIKRLHSLYAIYFNKRHSLVGHVFQGRYKAELIDSVPYLLQASKYIHLNPVKANLVTTPEEYRWSSYPHYYHPKSRIGSHQSSRLPNLVSEKVLEHFPNSIYKTYQEFIESTDEEKENSLLL